MRYQTLSDWLAWLETLHPSTIELGLERLRIVAQRLPELGVFNDPTRAMKVVTVGGTNGKGSCVATLEALCLATGQTVGAYTSPHLLRYNERIRIDGQFADDEPIMAAFEQVDRARGEVSLTYFEFGTLAALQLFSQADVDYAILEVGLGGRLDAVNLVDADVAVVTSIALDHQDWLGDNREAIGREKAGIFRGGRPALCADPEPPVSLLEVAEAVGAELLLASRDFDYSAATGEWNWRGLNHRRQALDWPGLPMPCLPLPSVAAALQAYLLLGNEPRREQFAALLPHLSLPGRCQQLTFRGRDLLLDVAHNPAAAGYLAEALGTASRSRTRAVFAVMADKDYREMLATLTSVVGYWYVAGLEDTPRAARAEDLLQTVRELGQPGQSCDTVEAALAAAIKDSKEGDRILVAGSFYTVGAALAFVESDLCQG